MGEGVQGECIVYAGAQTRLVVAVMVGDRGRKRQGDDEERDRSSWERRKQKIIDKSSCEQHQHREGTRGGGVGGGRKGEGWC